MFQSVDTDSNFVSYTAIVTVKQLPGWDINFSVQKIV